MGESWRNEGTAGRSLSIAEIERTVRRFQERADELNARARELFGIPAGVVKVAPDVFAQLCAHGPGLLGVDGRLTVAPELHVESCAWLPDGMMVSLGDGVLLTEDGPQSVMKLFRFPTGGGK